MFEEQGREGDAPPDGWWGLGPFGGPDPDPEPDADAVEARFEADLAAHLAGMTPAERAEFEYGVDPSAEPPRPSGHTVEEAAVAAQDVLEQLDRVERIVDAQRIAALVTAFEVSMEDLATRWGPAIGSRGGLGAQTFFRSTGLRLHVHPLRVAHLVDTATVAIRRLPRTWAVFRAGGTSWQRVDTAVAQAAGLDLDRWAAYDEVAAGAVAGSTRLKDTLRKARERLQDDTAPARARAARQRRAVDLEPGPDGQASLVLTGSAADLTAIDQALTRAAVAAHGAGAGAGGDFERRTVTQLRFDLARDLLVDGFGRLADPSARVPQRAPIDVRLVLTVPALAWLGIAHEQAQVAGYGPIDLETAKALAGSATSMLRVLTDPVTGVRLTMDRTVYSPPADLKRWVRVRDQRSRFPGGTRPAWLCDIDHAREWQHGGPTAAWNLVCLSRPEHNQKSAGLFQEELAANGTVGWDDAWGHHFDDPEPDPPDPAPAHLLPEDDGPPF